MSLINSDLAQNFLEASILLIVGLLVSYLLSASLGKLVKRNLNDHLAVVTRKIILYSGWILVMVMVLAHLGFDLTALVATAGVATIAIGFAAQTSLSNLISGMFLLVEKPFQIGDVIRVSGTMGVVHSIDLMSIKLRTFDNLYIRIPNETMIKSEVTTITRFPIRRMDFELRFAYRNDLQKVLKALEEVAAGNSFAMDEPAPVILIRKLGEHGIEILLGVWFEKTKFLDTRNSMSKDLIARFAADGIEIALPQLTTHIANGTPQLPVKLMSVDAE